MNIVELSCLFCYKHPQMLDKVTREVHMDDSNATTDINTPKNRYQDKIPCKYGTFLSYKRKVMLSS